MWVMFPRMVAVRNARLKALFVVLHVVFGTCVMFVFFWYKQWTSVTPVNDYLSVVMRAAVNEPGMREAERKMWRSMPCNGTGNFLTLESVSVSCPRLCSTLNPILHCINVFETASIFDGSRELFFVTSFLDSTPGGNFDNASYHLAPYAKHQQIQLQYGIQLPFQNPLKAFATTSRDDTAESEADLSAKYDITALSTVNVTTRLLNQHGNYVREVSPLQLLNFSLSEALALAGLEDVLDAKAPSFTTHLLPSNISPNITRRLTGVEILIRLHCRLQREYWSTRWAEVLCDASFLPSILQYAGKKRILSDGTVRHYGGVRVRITTHVDAEFLNLLKAYQALVGAIVVATLPRIIVTFIASFCLGSCSKVYSRLICERFSLQGAITTTTLRWIVGFASHKVLASTNGLISQQFIVDALHECISKRSRSLNDEDLCALVHMSMQNVADTSFASRRSKNHRRTSQVLDSDNFCVACLSGEAIEFDDLLYLLDTTRKRHVVERCFMPRELLETGQYVQGMKSMIANTILRQEQPEEMTPADMGSGSLDGLPSTTRNEDIPVKAETCQDSYVPGCLKVDRDSHVASENSVNSCMGESTRDTLALQIANLRVECGLLQKALQHQVMGRLDALERNVADLWEVMSSSPRCAGTMAITSRTTPASETHVSFARAVPASRSSSPTSAGVEPGDGDIVGTCGACRDARSDALYPDSDGEGSLAALNKSHTKVDEQTEKSLPADARVESPVFEPQPIAQLTTGFALQTTLTRTSCDSLTAAAATRAPNSAVNSHGRNKLQVLGSAIIPGSGPLDHPPCPVCT